MRSFSKIFSVIQTRHALNITLLILLFSSSEITLSQTILPLVPPEWRGTIDAERQGMHDANLIRTMFYNFGMVGDYPSDPLNVDLSIFHSVEIPKGSGENYSDGTTPFVLSKVIQTNGSPAYIMLTGYRERQGTSPFTNKSISLIFVVAAGSSICKNFAPFS